MTRPIPEQIIRFQAFAGMASECTNVGQSKDAEDLYDVFETMIDDMSRHMPPFACRSGCNQCCYFPPLVNSLEWAVVFDFIRKLPMSRQEALIETAEAMRPLADELGQLRRSALSADNAKAITDYPMQCPMLIDGRCTVYEARPLVCRGFGHTLRISDDKPAFYGSNLARAHIVANFPGDTPLPLFDPFADKIGELNQRAGGTEAFLPQWLWAHIENGRFVDEPITRPAF
jgi:Fe-S-cluster containining protein